MAGVREWLDRTSETWTPPGPSEVGGSFRFLFWLVREQGRRVVLGGVLGTCSMLGLVVGPWVLARVVDEGLVAGDTGALVGWTLVLLVVGVLNAVVGIGRHRTMTKIRMDASFRAIRATVWQTSRLGASLARRVDAGEVVTVGIADVQTVAQALTVTGPGIGAVVAYAVVAVALFAMSPVLAAVVLAGVPLLAVAVGPFLHRIERTSGDYRAHQAGLTTRLVDVLAGLRVLNGLGGKAFVAERYGRQSRDLVERGYRVAGPASWVGALAGGLPALFVAAVVWLSARLAAAGEISIGDVVGVYGYVAALIIPVSSLIEGGGDLARARVAGGRIVGLLNLPVPKEGAGGAPAGCGPLADPGSGVIVRPGVFTALVAARPGEAVAVIERLGRVDEAAAPSDRLREGRPGRGDAAGSVTWAGVPVGEVAREELRSRLLVADNDAEVFAGTGRDVVAGRLEADDGRIRAALRVAVAEDVVEALPRGLDATVAAGGSDLSGGQRQRLRLARAVYAGPDVLLAVDPTSAVDATTEAAMIERLREVRRGLTTVVTTSSPLVLARADEVVVLEDGYVAAVGTHAALLRGDPAYRALVSRAQDTQELRDAQDAGAGR
ncbi:ABC transporter ATP-binding protein [Nonomuraea sp. NPDC050328]|uniref:ABC transporter ATP-binding protein n=1 Tax=Nonomuraea sp. NPDC050328 TaxID=3364361 RepID=UPI0037AA97C3